MARRSLFLSPEVLARLAGRVERQILTELVTVLERVRAALPLDAVEQALLERNLPAAVEAIGLQPVQNALFAIPERTRSLRADAFHAEAGQLPARLQALATVQASLGVVAAQQPDVLAALDRQDLRRIRGISQGTEQAIRNHLRRGLEQGLNPKDTARHLRAVIGLTPQQEAAVAARRTRLAAQGRDPAQVERMVTRYADRQRRVRAEAIARTETIAALEGGKQLQRERLVREGTLDPGQWVQEWQTAADERVCPVCGPLDGETAPIGGTFPGGYAGPPAHPRCRCASLLRLAALAGTR